LNGRSTEYRWHTVSSKSLLPAPSITRSRRVALQNRIEDLSSAAALGPVPPEGWTQKGVEGDTGRAGSVTQKVEPLAPVREHTFCQLVHN
jgi:hypothetical protein